MARPVAVTTSVPQWLVDRVIMWQELLHLEHWHIRIDLALCVGDDPDNRAQCHQQHHIRMATLTFRADIQDDEEWNAHIAHEVLHVAHAQVDEMVESLIEQLPEQMADYALKQYVNAIEPFVENMSRTLLELRGIPVAVPERAEKES